MASEHYFSETPGSDYKLKEIQVVIDGASFTVETAGGIFSPDHIDQGTAVLLNHLDEAPPGGNVLDIGCGWGPIALSLAKRSPKAFIWAVDVNERSLELTKANASTSPIWCKNSTPRSAASLQTIRVMLQIKHAPWPGPPAYLHRRLAHVD